MYDLKEEKVFSLLEHDRKVSLPSFEQIIVFGEILN